MATIDSTLSEQRAGPGTTPTRKMAEDLTDYLTESGFKVRYLHSDLALVNLYYLAKPCSCRFLHAVVLSV
ncbi:MAG: hypothetical protein IBX61_09660 [Thermoleophilia bacterium]|nr:hypothetical protein [Thermoleophilia bacterium]